MYLLVTEGGVSVQGWASGKKEGREGRDPRKKDRWSGIERLERRVGRNELDPWVRRSHDAVNYWQTHGPTGH